MNSHVPSGAPGFLFRSALRLDRWRCSTWARADLQLAELIEVLPQVDPLGLVNPWRSSEGSGSSPRRVRRSTDSDARCLCVRPVEWVAAKYWRIL